MEKENKNKEDNAQIEPQKINTPEEKSKNSLPQKGEETDENKIVYSNYGYIKVKKKELENEELLIVNFIQYKNGLNNEEKCLKGTISKKNIYECIDIKIKTFSGQRKTYIINKFNILSNLNLIMDEMIKIDKIAEESTEEKEPINITYKKTNKSQFRLYSSRFGVKELNISENLCDNDIKQNEMLVYLPEIKLVFSDNIKNKSIEFSKDKITALKINTDIPQYILGNFGYQFGKHYFEVNLLTEPFAQSVTIGLATKKNKNSYLNDVQDFYGFILSDKQKVTNINGKQEVSEYGENCCINENIGVLFESKANGVFITFYKQNHSLGIAFSELPNNKIYYPTVLLGLCGSKVKINNQVDFPE